jgi:hypothetical protein
MIDKDKNKIEIAAYYFPNYHQDARNAAWHGMGWTEWNLVRHAQPRFPGHNQPKIPLWGYEDESDPAVMEKKISAAADHGVTSFIYDWYWYEDGPFLNRCLDEGFLAASNNRRLKFALMWANHDWAEIHPATRVQPYPVRMSGQLSEKAFIEATDYMIAHYFVHPSYWRVEGGLYFSFYELMGIVKGFGGIGNTKRIMDDFRDRVKAAGLGELHLNAVIWGVQILPGETMIANPDELVQALGFDSVTSYVWIHHVEMNEFPQTGYAWCREEAFKVFEKIRKEFTVPYFPNVTMGWDSSPRTIQSDVFDPLGYPFIPVLEGNTPDEFKKALEQAKIFIGDSTAAPRILTINAWNEWTEGSYLEPDTRNGMGYLEAIREVFW